MRVLTVVYGLGPGGTERAAQNYAIGYKEAGWDSAILAITGGGPEERELHEQGIPLFIGGESSSERNTAVIDADSWNPDLIHIHRRGFSERITAEVLKALKTSRRRVLETSVFSRVDYSPDARLIDLHLHLSKWCLWKWKQWSRILNPAPFGVVIPYPVRASVFHPVTSSLRTAFRESRGIPDDAFVFGRVGQPLLPKWSEAIFPAFAEAAAKYRNVWLLLVGLPKELRPAKERLPGPVRQRIVEIPFLHDDESLRACYSAMDAFLHASSIGESFGMVLAEAMLCGCPVITLSTPARDNSQLEVVGHERGGLVTTDRRSLVVAMERLIADGALRERLSLQGAAWVREHYDLNQVMRPLISLSRIAMAAETREQLQTALRDDPSLVTDVTDAEIQDLLSRTTGETPFRERLLMRLIHQPRLYRWYSHRLR